MTTLLRMKVESNGYIGGPGVNVLTFSAGLTEPSWTQGNVDWVYDEVADIYNSLEPFAINGVTFALPAVCDLFDSASGNVTGVATPTETPAVLTGTNTDTHASRGLSLCVNYYTDVWHTGRRLRGRSFMGPMGSNVVALNGQTDPNLMSAVPGYFAAITTGLGPRLAVYHRPIGELASGGFYGDVTAVLVAAKPSTLRSRRD